MRIWLVNPFDPLPGDPEQEGRYATLARLLANKGHKVTWWTSSFSHRFKKPVDQQEITTVCRLLNIDVRFLEVPAYHRNVGLARLWNHYLLAKHFSKAVQSEGEVPEIVLASAPPPWLCRAAVFYANEHGAKAIVDVQDLWPETFYRLAKNVSRRIIATVLWPWHKASREAYKAADGIVGVADGYVKRAVELAGEKQITATIPLGIDLGDFDKAAKNGYCQEYTKPEGEIWLAYTGSLNRSYDCLTLVRAFAKIRKTINVSLRLFITSRGELRAEIEDFIKKENLSNVKLTDFLDFPRYAYLLSQCDIGFNASFPEAMIYLPNKIFYYLAAGLVVLNTISGQCSQIVREGHCGLDYQAGNVDSCIKAIKEVINNREEMIAMQRNSRSLAENSFDRMVLYPRYVDFIEQLDD